MATDIIINNISDRPTMQQRIAPLIQSLDFGVRELRLGLGLGRGLLSTRGIPLEATSSACVSLQYDYT